MRWYAGLITTSSPIQSCLPKLTHWPGNSFSCSSIKFAFFFGQSSWWEMSQSGFEQRIEELSQSHQSFLPGIDSAIDLGPPLCLRGLSAISQPIFLMFLIYPSLTLTLASDFRCPTEPDHSDQFKHGWNHHLKILDKKIPPRFDKTKWWWITDHQLEPRQRLGAASKTFQEQRHFITSDRHRTSFHESSVPVAPVKGLKQAKIKHWAYAMQRPNLAGEEERPGKGEKRATKTTEAPE